MTSIYIIKNTINNIVYVGQTQQTLNQRLAHHFSNINSSNSYFYRSMKELGIDKFYIELLEVVNDEISDIKELEWIMKIKEKYPLYNTKFSLGKCGGDTLSNHPNIKEIGKIISEKVMGGNNSQATKVCSVDINTNNRINFGSVSECQRYYNIPRHDIITRRCSGKIKKPFNGLLFEYL